MPVEETKDKNISIKNERASSASFVFRSAIFIALVGIDQLTKYLAFQGSFGNFLNALKPSIKKFHYFNHNFAFSLPVPVGLMYLIYAAILFAIIRYLVKNWISISSSAKTAWLLIMAGAISNIGERILLGYVRDFVYILSGIFNLADGYIIAGVAMLLAKSFKDKP
jgi:signal peptidase II